MTKLRLLLDKTPKQIIKKPYSVEIVGPYYQYQIKTYGFEHLIPEVLLYELEHGLYNILEKIDNVPKSFHLFELSTKAEYQIFNIKNAYREANILDFSFTSKNDKIIITQITPLSKLLKSQDPKLVAISILSYCFIGCKLNYSKSPTCSIKKLDFKNINSTVANNLKWLFPSHIGTSVLVPVHFLHFSTIQECMMYTLEYLYPNLETDDRVLKVPNEKFSFLKLLRGLKINEHYFLDIGSCSRGVPLINKLSSAYSTFCKNPFYCNLKQKKLNSTGWTKIENELYIWTSDNNLKNLIKNSLEVWIPNLVIKNREQSKDNVNQIWVFNKKIGSIYSEKETYVFIIDDYAFLFQ